jgi:oligopeptide/dipeptide ABC transporter ATP-binding protein
VNSSAATNGSPLIEIRGLSKTYSLRGGMLDRIRRRPRASLRALQDVDLSIYRGEIVGLVGESGSGKTTFGRCLLRLVEPTSGQVLFEGRDVLRLPAGQLRPMRRKLQMIFQDPYSSLNPRMTIYQTLAEVFVVHRLCPPAEIKLRVAELLELVGLPADAAARYPRHLSGGQRQRVGIARALAVHPEFIVADEPVSAVDVSIQAQVLNLLLDLKARLHLTLLFIAHDLSVVQSISNRVAVMYLGKLVEVAPVQTLYTVPRHPYTQGLLLAAPQPDPRHRTKRVALEGDPPSPLRPPPGCPFHTRCYLATERCRVEVPPLLDLGGGQKVACHYHDKAAALAPDLLRRGEPAVR